MYPISNEVKALFESEQKQILRITGGVKTPIPNSVGPAAIASFDNAIAANALNLSVDIEPVQSGSGDPSPTNVRPISGWTGAKVTRCGENLAEKADNIIGNLSVNVADDGTLTINGTSSTYCYIRGYFNCPDESATYTWALFNPNVVAQSGVEFSVRDRNTSPAGGWDVVNTPYMTKTFVPDSRKKPVYWRFQLSPGITFNNVVFKPMIVLGSIAPEIYKPYAGDTYDIAFPSEAGTVYGGTLDVTTGLLTVDRGNIASYAGETLPGAWISSMDVYTAGGTPTTGAQVVYELATPITYQLPPTQIALLAGMNNVWADCGDVTVDYATGYEYEINITDANVVLGSFNIDRFSCIGNKLEVGTATSAQMTVKLDNYDGRFNGIVFEGTELFVEIGIADWTQNNPTINWIPCGYFTPDEQPRSLNIITIHALDRMMQFDATMPTLTPWVTQSGDVMMDSQGNIIYFVSNVQFPVTVQNLVKRVALLCGVPFTQSLTSFPNYNYTIQALPTLQQDITFRNIIQWCAGIMGANAWIDWTGSLRFSWYGATTGYTSTTANRFSSDLHEDDITITGVQYTNTQNVTIVSGSADYAIDMTGNYLAAVGISTILPNIRSRISGFTYRPFTATVINAPYLWPMDMITFVKDGVNNTCAVTNVNFGINGTTALEGKGETAQTNSGTAPSGVTKEQGFLIEQAYEATTALDQSLNQEGIFNRLTNNGEAQGIYIIDGQVYVNMTYARSGTLVLGGLNNTNGVLQVLDESGNLIGTWNNDGVLITKGSIDIQHYTSATNNNYIKIAYNNGSSINMYSLSNSGNHEVTSIYSPDQYIIQGRDYSNTYENKATSTGVYIESNDILGQYPQIVLKKTSGANSLTITTRDIDWIQDSEPYIQVGYKHSARAGLWLYTDFSATGTKSRLVSTDQYSKRYLYCYETPTPMFGDIGEGTIGEDGLCYISLDAVFAQTVVTQQYQVFLQRYGEGECWVRERKSGYFIVQGTPGLAFGWEIKAKQRDYDQLRLERADEPFAVPEQTYGADAAQYIDDLRKERISA